MKKLPAKTGWLWIWQGCTLFYKQPIAIMTLFLSYLLLMLILSKVPIIGQLLPFILMPVFAISFMQACDHIKRGQRVSLGLLLVGFRSPSLRGLLALGIVYVLAIIVVMLISRLIDDGAFWQAMTGPGLAVKDLENSHTRTAILITVLVYIPAMMAFWFAPPLIAWQRMPLGKALFYSFFAIWNAGKAFIVYSLAWIMISFLLPTMVNDIIALLTNDMAFHTFIFLPLSIILTVIMYCSFYFTYTSIFNQSVITSH